MALPATHHCCRGLVVQQLIDIFCPSGTQQQQICCYGPMLGQTDGWTPDRFIDPARHTMRSVPVIARAMAPFLYDSWAVVKVTGWLGLLSVWMRRGSRYCRSLWSWQMMSTVAWDSPDSTPSSAYCHCSTTVSAHFYTTRMPVVATSIRCKKVAYTRSPSVGFRSWSWILAVSLQVTWVMTWQ